MPFWRSSFAPLRAGSLDLQDCSPADIALSLCRMVSYNVAQVCCSIWQHLLTMRSSSKGSYRKASAAGQDTRLQVATARLAQSGQGAQPVHIVCLQIAYEVATSHGLQRVLFGGFFIRANGFTMETITFALDFWSKASRTRHVSPASLIVSSDGPNMALLMSPIVSSL